jgi:hypothetical protein
MKSFLFTFLLAIGTCVVPKPPVVIPTTMTIYVEVYDDSIHAKVSNASVRYWFSGDVSTAKTQITDVNGNTAFIVPSSITSSHMWVTAVDYLDTEQHVDATPFKIVQFHLTRRPPPIVPHIPPGMDAPYNANICGMKDSSGEVIFDGNIPDLTDVKRIEWYTLKQKAGLTDVVLAAKGGYRGHYYDLTHNPARLIELGNEARSYGFRVTWFLSSGDQGTSVDIDSYFGSLIDSLAQFHNNSFWTPGWEVVAGGWPSERLNHALDIMNQHLPSTAQIWVHLSDTRPTFNSNPVELNDPWRSWTYGHFEGDKFISEGSCLDDSCASQHTIGKWDGREPDAWSLHTGYNGVPVFGWRVNGLFYQTESGDQLLHPERYPTEYIGHPGYQSRLYEISIRTLIGERGWRKARVCIFETIAEDYWNGRAIEGDAKIIADACKKMGFMEFGNGQ